MTLTEKRRRDEHREWAQISVVSVAFHAVAAADRRSMYSSRHEEAVRREVQYVEEAALVSGWATDDGDPEELALCLRYQRPRKKERR